MKKIKLMSMMVALLMMASFVVGCGADTNGDSNETSNGGSSEADTIKVGLNYELSGNVASYGTDLSDGVEMALEEINAAGGLLGKQIEVIKMDNTSDSAEAANISTRLITRENVVTILGPATSGNTKGAIPPANQNGIPLVSASATADDVTVDSNGNVREYIFKTCFSDSYQGITMANFAFDDLGKTNAAILFENTSDYSIGITENFKELFTDLGASIVSEEAYQSKETDFRAVLTNIKAANPDVLLVPGYYEEVGLIIRQARELGIDVPVLGGDGYDSPNIVELAGEEALNDVYYSNHYSPMDTSPEVVAFREAFTAKFNKEAGAFHAMGYDLGYFFADAVERAGEATPDKIRDAMASTVDFKGITGTLSIDEFHNPVKAVTILELVDGEPTFLKKLEP
ncbi:MAG TPA: ABC transporter substrate-binding protein [Tissierellaceae bacterium]|nr:ABC transporter substrate-binding protein [Tissierellaceae bacterium]